MTVSDGVIVSAFGTAFTVLGFTIKVLWSKCSSWFKYLEQRSADCEQDREDLRSNILTLSIKVSNALNCNLSACPNKDQKHP